MAEKCLPWITISATIAKGIVNDIPRVATRGVVHTTDSALFQHKKKKNMHKREKVMVSTNALAEVQI